MKSKLVLTALAAIVALGQLSAENLAADAAVFIQPDAKTTVIGRLNAGTPLVVVGEAPAGWRRVEVPGPFEGYVNNQDITKGLEVRTGASIHSAPRKDAPVMTTAVEGDKTELIGLANNDWAQIRLDKKLQGFIAVGETANRPAETKPISRPTLPPAPVSPPVAPATAIGRPAPAATNNAALPRMFTGKLVVARRVILNPNPPYDYQLTDSTGRRFAYVDTKRLLLTDKIEAYLDRDISVTGTMRNTVDGKDLVIAAESMKLN
jgi:hypothetical protein